MSEESRGEVTVDENDGRHGRPKMSEESRGEVKSVVRQHDPGAEDLRTLADDLEALSKRYDRQDEIL